MDGSELEPLDNTFSEAAQAQEALGWDKGLLGHISPLWHEKLSQIIPEKATWWTTKLLLWLIQLGYAFWEAQNKRTHQGQKSILHTNLAIQVKTLIGENPQLPPDAQSLFQRMAELMQEEIDRLPTAALQLWLLRIKQERTQATTQDSQDGSRRIMANWLRG